MKIKNVIPEALSDIPISAKLMNIRHYSSHMHEDSLELLYCISGNLNLVSAHMDYLQLHENELLLLDRNDIHYAWADDDNKILVVHIGLADYSLYAERVKYLFFSCATFLCKPEQQASMDKIIDLMLAAAYVRYSDETCRTAIYKKLYDSLSTLLVEEFSWFAVENLTSRENEKYRERLEGILKYVQLHYDEKITVSQLAKRYYINENYLSQFLKTTSFESFSMLLQYIRCYEAERLLLTTDMKIQEISDRCGFSSVKYFHKYFKLLWRITPLQHKFRHLRFCSEPDNFFEYEKNTAFTTVRDHIEKRHIDKFIEI